MDHLVSDRILINEEQLAEAIVFFDKHSKIHNVQVLKANWADTSKCCVKFVADSKRSMLKFIESIKHTSFIESIPDWKSIGFFVMSLSEIEGEPFFEVN